jgi:RNAse (barnase) inhibitor barstar
MEHLTKHDIGTFRVVCLASTSGDILRADLDTAGFACYFLDSSSIIDKESFFEQLSHGCELSIDSSKRLTSWDAASDLLWQKLMEQSKDKVAIIWRDAHLMLDGRLQLLLDCLEFLLGVAEMVERQEVTPDSHPVFLRVILIGEGTNYYVCK